METTKTKIIRALKKTNRKGIENLIDWMEENGFFSAPCSTKYHNSFEGGLAEHSYNVMNICYSLLESLYFSRYLNLTEEELNSVVIVSLLHDLGKCGQFGKQNYVRKNDSEYETNKDLLYIPHEVRSIAIASQFIKLTEEEQFAILYHNGLYGELKSIKGNETPLYMILHFSDMWASRVLEKEEKE